MNFSRNDSTIARPKVVITAKSDEFDQVTIQNWTAEGFEVSYLPYTGSREDYVGYLQRLADSLELGEGFAIIGMRDLVRIRRNSSHELKLHFPAAYGDAASVALDVAVKPIPKLCALVAYYPGTVPAIGAEFLIGHNIAVHLAGPLSNAPNCRFYSYPAVEAGFAEENLEQYDKVSASLAWSRTLSILRKAFDIEVDLEKIWDDHVACQFPRLKKFNPKAADQRSPEKWSSSPNTQTPPFPPWSPNPPSTTSPPSPAASATPTSTASTATTSSPATRPHYS